MSLSVTLACIWALVANVLAMLPSRDQHWRNAYILMAVGVPVLGYVTVQHGPWVGLLILAAGCSILRWPVIYLARWVGKQMGRAKGPAE